MTELTDEAVKALLDGTTPGPWYWEETHPENACAVVRAKSEDGHDLEIATLYGCTDGVPAPTMPDEPWGDHPIRRADAALCAAAPILARALLDARAELDEAFAAGVVHGQKALQAITGPLQVVDSPELAELRAENARLRADAQAAVALVVEQAAEVARKRADQHADMALNGLPENARLREAMEAAFTDMRWAIRALADIDGLAAVEALRKERDDALELAEERLRGQHRLSNQLNDTVRDLNAELAAAQQREAGLLGLIRWAHETLWELNPNNYDHDEVCKVNDAAVEVILGLAPVIGETHGYSAEWWAERAALSHNGNPSKEKS